VRGLSLQEQVLKPWVHLPEYLTLAKIYRSRGRYTEADDTVKRAMDYTLETRGGMGLPFAECLEERAAIYREGKLGAGYEPDQWEGSAKAIRKMKGLPSTPPE
jgi:hypothetical protein